MPRYKLTLEYDGGPFVGWQRQANGLSVQEVIEAAVLAFCQQTVTVQGAGRTDAGVHALGQVAHLDLPRAYPPLRVRDALNAHLRPHPVVVLAAEQVEEHFHARFSAIERHYLYRVLNRKTPPALAAGRAWWVPTPLDEAAMAEAARCLVGRHDFSTFRASGCQATSPVRTLALLTIVREGDSIAVTARARSFLHHQVRNMVGTLRLVGEGRWTSADLAAALALRDRRAGGPTAPAHGLYLTEVVYPQGMFSDPSDP
ncbi:MAG: truA [Rhodospirillaceae bacterium]|nr:MAG: truA [Rhodospirillaceae bacterium]